MSVAASVCMLFILLFATPLIGYLPVPILSGIVTTALIGILDKKLRDRGIRFYLAEHDGSLNDQLRALGAESLLTSGTIRRTITIALWDAGLEKPYELDEDEGHRQKLLHHAPEDHDGREKLAEQEWLFGGRNSNGR